MELFLNQHFCEDEEKKEVRNKRDGTDILFSAVTGSFEVMIAFRNHP